MTEPKAATDEQIRNLVRATGGHSPPYWHEVDALVARIRQEQERSKKQNEANLGLVTKIGLLRADIERLTTALVEADSLLRRVQLQGYKSAIYSDTMIGTYEIRYCKEGGDPIRAYLRSTTTTKGETQ